jgi:hypothetical protein
MRGCKKRMKPQADKVGRGLRTRRCLQVSALCVVALATTSCVTVGYDFLRQQATVTYNHQPKTDGFKK